MRRLIAVAVSLVVVLAAHRAGAQGPDEQTVVPETPAETTTERPPAPPAPAPRPTYRFAVEPSVGVGTPLGWLGGALSIKPLPMLVLHAGAGLGSQSVQLAAGARLAVRRSERTSAWVGVGWSSGAFVQQGATTIFPSVWDDAQFWYWKRAHFVNLEASFERQLTGRLGARLFTGIAGLVNRDDAICGARYCSGEPTPLPILPYLGAALVVGLL
jgi:hypothetical protein